ncbi:frizzled-5, partial [Striga asiatica]
IPCGLPVSLRCLPQRPNGPNNRENNRTAAYNINQQENLIPSYPILDKGTSLPNNNRSNICQDLQWDHNHQHLFLLLLQKWLQKRPPGTNQNNHSEQQHATNKLENVKQYIPSVRRPCDLHVMFVLCSTEQIQCLHNHKKPHEKMNPVHRLLILQAGIDPIGQERKIQNRKAEIERRQLDSGAQLAKNSEYSFGAVIGYEWLNEEWGGGDRSRKVKRRLMYLESRTQKEGFDWSSRSTWIRDSSERRKKPNLDGSGEPTADMTETAETVIVACPVCVKPNRSKRIMGRESADILRFLISAEARGVKNSRIGRRRRSFAISIGETEGGSGTAAAVERRRRL